MSDDGYTRITLRIPNALDEHLNESAKSTSKSKNAEIISRLQDSFTETSPVISTGFVSVPHYDNAAPPLVLPSGLLGTSYLSTNCKYSYVTGTSMEPALFDGDIAVFDGILPKDGSLAAFKYEGAFFIKRFQMEDDDAFLMVSDNPKHASRLFTKDTCEKEGFLMIGTVICVIGRR